MKSQKKLDLFFYFFSFCAFVLMGRIVYIQIFYKDRLQVFAKRQFSKKITLEGRRGSILDRENKDLAFSVKTYSFFVDPMLVKNPAEFSTVFSGLLKINRQDLKKRLLRNKKKRFLWLKRHVSSDQYKKMKLKAYNSWRSWGVIPEFKREYPRGVLAPQLLGVVSRDAKGLEGLERLYDERLRGIEKTFLIERDARGRSFFLTDKELYSRAEDTENLVLTLDRPLQQLIQAEVDKARNSTGSRFAYALLTDIQTGAILSWVQSPRFDPRDYGKYPRLLRRNHVLTDPFEPGSVVKPFFVAEALERQLLKEEDKIYIPGAKIQIGRKVFRDSGQRKFEKISLEGLLQFSSNLGVIKLQSLLGAKASNELFKKLEFTKKVLNLPGESRGLMRSFSNKSPLENATMSFGQGFAVTPLQILRAYSALFSHDGKVNDLFLVSDLSKKEFKKWSQKDEKRKRIFSKKVQEQLKKMLSKVVTEGTGYRADFLSFDIAGKTGTAQKVKNGEKGYQKDLYQASFVGAFPVNNPRFLAYVMLDEPEKEKHTGGVIAAPLFKNIALHAMRELGRLDVFSKKDSSTVRFQEIVR